MSRVRKVTFEEFIWLFISLQRHHFTHGEPIPELNRDDINMVNHCLESPFGGFGEDEFYPTLQNKIAVMFYLFAKRHSVGNGNKRIAVEITSYFAFKNRRRVIIENDLLIEMAYNIAISNPDDKEKWVKILTHFFTSGLKPFPFGLRMRFMILSIKRKTLDFVLSVLKGILKMLNRLRKFLLKYSNGDSTR